MSEPRLLELCRRVVDQATDRPDLFRDDASVQVILDDQAAESFPITPEDNPRIACSRWTAPEGGWPEREWLIKGWLPVGRLGMLSGRGGRGKSRLVLQLAARIANQKPLEGHVLQAGDVVESGAKRQRFTLEGKHCGRVVFASWEDEYQEVGRRLAAMAQDGLVDVKGLKDRLLYLDLRGMGAAWAPGSQKHVQTVAGLTGVGRRLRATVESMDARLLVLDSLAGAYASDENVRPLVRAFCADWDAWGTEHRCAVLLIAHPPKRPARSTGSTTDEDTDDDFAGSTDWHNAVRWRWSLGNADTTYRRVQKHSSAKQPKGERVSALALTCQKSSYGEQPDQILFLGPADTGKIGFKLVPPAVAARRAVKRYPGWELKDTEADSAEAENDPDAIRR